MAKSENKRRTKGEGSLEFNEKKKNGSLESQRIGQTVHLSEKLLRERRRGKPRASGMNG
ncbi:MAG: hypothetical protein ACLVBX_04870 [Faecalibacterium prausnitzii]